jgi:hypothetical protein
MHSNRSNRNTQQLRSILQTMGRSIDEARTRRMGPSAPQAPSAPPARSESTPKPEVQPPVNSGNGAAPPIRAANEMFVDGGPRLKARPKRPS